MRKRKKIKKKSKIVNIVLLIIFLLSFAYIFIFVDPKIWQEIYYAPFLANIALIIFLLCNLFIRKIIISILISLGIIAFLILRMFGFREFYYPILIAGLIATLSYFFTIEEDVDKLKNIEKEKNASK